jgi:hypothetical protein
MKKRRFLPWRDSVAAWMTIIGFPTVVIGGVVGYYQLQDYLVRPEISMQFAIRTDENPQHIEFLLVNNSSRTADSPYYGFVLRDLDAPQKVLPIPFEVTTFIKPGQSQGYNPLTENYGEPDHRYFGTAMVTCDDCASVKNYFLYIDNKEPDKGFYYLLSDQDNTVKEFQKSGDVNVFPEAGRVAFKKL